MKFHFSILASFFALVILLSCQPPDEDSATEADFENWYPQYNRYVRDWLAKQVEEIEGELKKLNEEFADEKDDARKKKLEDTKSVKTKLLNRMRARLGMGDYFQFKTMADLPSDLVWKNGLEQPEIGDPAA